MATSGIGRIVVISNDDIKTLEDMLFREKTLVENNKDLLVRRALRRDYMSVKTLSDIR